MSRNVPGRPRDRIPGAVDPGPPFITAGLKLHLEADVEAYSDAGITLATNGVAVQQWNDQSPSGDNATQLVLGNRPTFVASATNGRPGILWDGTDDYFDFASPLIGANQSLFIVAQITAAVAVVVSSAAAGNRYLANPGTDAMRWAHFDPNFADSPAGVGLVNFNIISSIQRGSSATTWLNGVAGVTNPAMDMGDASTLDRLGFYPAPVFMKGIICELLYYDYDLSNAYRIVNETYLKWKYATP